ncbi:MAG: ABC transporter ATP-binding protein [Sulfurimonas sp. RIFOXYD12_FULL_33_39]|uniref:ABC transporter ATP-binding protein n=1 Tax=unclassified Sulfurimonas TaxID=2623549 RepID=UPI0008B54022|nr:MULTISPECIES: ABC transporter ATP-binding protein [unclassified Sulfurimonas]OHE07817.1 MAG: ABC transporter ATP-binding protein [Sulfurimonas sp. RIFCSPLOWO2_12_FULL_34_6]OHE10019.1 MAG: ABC transporter ATP-binding protein [Sulfurimonas sp. RIFOXYD12_FULL_33_39]OHE14761.1 MAG: ABC transporter ATP-binding protein [Sulfurimonas sp. RIFOXYD2_FULL_34_21]
MIKLIDIVKKYEVNKNNIVTALKDINIEIKEGELVVLKGASGSGKSTILSLIAALSKPTSGEVIVGDNRVSKFPDNFASDFRRDNIGFVFQKYNLIPTLSVKENIILPLLPMNLHVKEIETKLERVLKMFHIEHKANQLVKNLSGGEQQRVAIARANINTPKIILADEPTANLDEKLSLHFIDMLKELKAEGKTIVVATHDPLFFGLDIVDKEIEIHQGVLS